MPRDETPLQKLNRLTDTTAPIVPYSVERTECVNCGMVILVQADICPACGHCPICGKTHKDKICK